MLARLLAARAEKARLLGFANSAELQLQKLSLTSTHQVRSFLARWTAQQKPGWLREAEELRKFARPTKDYAFYAKRLRGRLAGIGVAFPAHRQLPFAGRKGLELSVAVLSCSLSSLPGQPLLLKHEQTRTLFREFGRCLQQLLHRQADSLMILLTSQKGQQEARTLMLASLVLKIAGFSTMRRASACVSGCLHRALPDPSWYPSRRFWDERSMSSLHLC